MTVRSLPLLRRVFVKENALVIKRCCASDHGVWILSGSFLIYLKTKLCRQHKRARRAWKQIATKLRGRVAPVGLVKHIVDGEI